MSITKPKGFLASGVKAGLKASGKPDLAVVRNCGPSFVAAGVFTSNRVVAAPVVLSRQHLNNGTAQAIVLNSGGANACTGPAGFKDAQNTAATLADALAIAPSEVLVCSTGLIGTRLDLNKLLPGIGQAVSHLHDQGGLEAAQAIMTTDTVAKQTWQDQGAWSIGGMAKGAGMLAPGLATMLCVLTTDAQIDSDLAQRALAQATSKTFNRIDSDGCMSTNDSVILLASGASKIAVTEEEFTHCLTVACSDLARQLINDAEGASHNITIEISGATSVEGALVGARAVARSNLVKTAIFGNDPNWGRILSELGTVPEDVLPFSPEQVDVSINGVPVCKKGAGRSSPPTVDMTPREVHILIELHAGPKSVSLLTNDLTHDYVHENSAYSS